MHCYLNSYSFGQVMFLPSWRKNVLFSVAKSRPTAIARGQRAQIYTSTHDITTTFVNRLVTKIVRAQLPVMNLYC